IFHPREKIHVVAPGDPVFSRGGGSDSANSALHDSRAGHGHGHGHSHGHASRAGSRTGSSSSDIASGGDLLSRIKPPRLIITSMRLLVFQGDHWVSHFFADMVDELPSILSWSEERGWHRSLD